MIALTRIAAVALLCAAAFSTALRPSGADKAVPVPAPSPKSAEARADSEVIEGSGGETRPVVAAPEHHRARPRRADRVGPRAGSARRGAESRSQNPSRRPAADGQRIDFVSPRRHTQRYGSSSFLALLGPQPPKARSGVSGSALRAAYEIADANARAELLAAVRAGLASSLSAGGPASIGKASLAPDSPEVNKQLLQVAGVFLPSVKGPPLGAQ